MTSAAERRLPSDPPDGSPSSSRRRAAAGILFALLAAAGAAAAIARNRHSFVAAYDRLGPGVVLGAFGCGLVGTTATYLTWSEVLSGYGVSMPARSSLRMFFISQLGKYLPGSVWPALMQMEAGARRGANRRTVLGANLTAIVLGCTTGLLIGCGLVPWFVPAAISRYWWVLLAVPGLLALMHPRALPALLDLAFHALRRPPLTERLAPANEVRAAAWCLLNWAGLGAMTGVLGLGVVGDRPVLSVLLLSIGAMALATTAGILFIPAPAGAGVREAVLVFVLSSIMPAGSALAISITSRALLVGCDLLLAGIAAVPISIRRGAVAQEGASD